MKYYKKQKRNHSRYKKKCVRVGNLTILSLRYIRNSILDKYTATNLY